MTTVTALWRGEVPLARTGWIFGVLGLVLLIAPLVVLTRTGVPAAASSPVALALSVAILAYAGFIGVAVWRSADRYRGAQAWRWVAKGSVLFIVLQVIAGLNAG